MDNNVIIIGGSHHNTLGVVRALGQKGLKPFVIIVGKGNDSFVLQSKYVADGIMVRSSDEAVVYVIDHFSDEKLTIIYSCTDSVTCSLDRYYDKLKTNCIFFNGKKAGKLNYLTNKYEMQQLAVACGLHIPLTVKITSEVMTDEIVYPCVTKDIDNVCGSKSHMKLFDNERQLNDYLHEHKNDYSMLVQQYIEKDLEYQLIGCSVQNSEGSYDVIIPGHTKILRAQPVTNTGFLEYYSNDGFEYDEEACKRFIEACEYTGLFSLEFIRGKDGKDYFLEINFRNDGNAYVVTKAGVNLPYIFFLNAIGEDYSSEVRKPISKQVSMPVIKDFKTVFQGRVSIFQWIKDLKRTNCFFYKDKEDPVPMRAYLIELIKNRI